MSENENTASLPAPISLTLEEALEVAGGTTFVAGYFLHDYIINGLPAVRWVNPTPLVPGPVLQNTAYSG